MKDIDFLPSRYRERTAQRRARLWRGLILCCLTAFVGAVALAQLALQRPIEQQLAVVNTQYPAAVAAATRSDILEKELTEIDAFAAVYTYLRHPWPATQLLAGLTDPLPDSVVITEITLDRKPAANTPAAELPGNPIQTATEAAKRDLARLRSLHDGVVPAVHVTGITSDATSLHGYVSKLAPSPLFKAAKIESLEAVASDSGINGSRFELRLLVRPGFGQPDGPDKPLVESTTSLASSSANPTAKP
jgi:Tfp pilus assembly protein PilN